MAMQDLMKQLSMEADELAASEAGVTSDMFEEMSDEEPRETATDMVAHADKAQFVADQLDDLADKAEEIAQEDKEHMLNEVSTEAMSMVYRNIMASNGLDLRATSFEANYDHLGKMRGLAQDARASAKQMHGLHDSILDFSPEGKFFSFLRMDKLKLKKAYDDVIQSKNRLGNVDKKPVRSKLLQPRLYGIAYRNGRPVKDVSVEILKDVDLLIESKKTIETNIKLVNDWISKLKDGQDVKLPELKDSGVLNTPLLGNRQVNKDSTAYNQANRIKDNPIYGSGIAPWKFVTASAIAGGVAGVITASGGAAGGLVPIVLVAGVGIHNHIKDNEQLASTGTSVDLGDIDKVLAGFRKLDTVMSREFHVDDSIVKQAKEVGNDEAVRAAKKAYATLYQNLEMVYEHGFYLITRFGTLLSVMD